MARLRGALAGLSITGAPPQQLVGWLNDLVRFVAPEHTASVIAGYFDPPTGQLTWSQAGHPPPVLVRAGIAAELPQPTGIMLGAGELPYATERIRLLPGDLLLMYSDGLIERRDHSLDDDGLARLLTAAASADDPDRVIAAVLRAMGSGAEDDTCLVAVQVTGQS
jgi:serine phosphatase RsbU (regulator of sigma subunit)